ncbi:hypothetical protein LptCag_0858 [Leptospirillum ferriphilum]|uniref:Uncharacterized protein n=1 Tax=Leptospirillum ferriphilum TaxID=178606 RepID=A0A094W6B7_9BACT|nr:hypothetical protein LptCag_0858 [Leptospirillum ferriphilum]
MVRKFQETNPGIGIRVMRRNFCNDSSGRRMDVEESFGTATADGSGNRVRSR